MFNFGQVNLKFSTDSSSVEGKTELVTSFSVSSQLITSANATKTHLLFTSNESAQTICVCLRSSNEAQQSYDLVQIWNASVLNPNNFIEISKEASGCTLVKEVRRIRRTNKYELIELVKD